MLWWAEDCQYYEFPDRLLAQSAAEIRARHVVRFQEPNLHGRLISRISVGNLVIDREIVTRDFPDGPGEIDVIALYEIDAGRIGKAWFKMGPPRLSVGAVLRRAAAGDADAIRALTRLAYAKWVPIIGREPTPMTVDYQQRVHDHQIDTLYVGNVLVALIELVFEPDHLLIENVAVHPDFQGRGYGRHLLAHAEAVATAHGLPELRLYTNVLFAENLQLYHKLGYRFDRAEPFKSSLTIHMSKPVAGPSHDAQDSAL
jgi:N-acetylglutamate synthase-like GNAT family acetyltransferase